MDRETGKWSERVEETARARGRLPEEGSARGRNREGYLDRYKEKRSEGDLWRSCDVERERSRIRVRSIEAMRDDRENRNDNRERSGVDRDKAGGCDRDGRMILEKQRVRPSFPPSSAEALPLSRHGGGRDTSGDCHRRLSHTILDKKQGRRPFPPSTPESLLRTGWLRGVDVTYRAPEREWGLTGRVGRSGGIICDCMHCRGRKVRAK